jgi:hypothetical protein
MRLGNPDPRQSFLASFQPAVDEAYSVLRSALGEGSITQPEHDAFVQQLDAAEAEVETLLASGATLVGDAGIETRHTLFVAEQRVLTLISTVRMRGRAAQDAARRRMFFWSAGSVALGLVAAFAWLAISKRKAV